MFKRKILLDRNDILTPRFELYTVFLNSVYIKLRALFLANQLFLF